MLLIESSRIDVEFFRIVEGLDAPVPAVAKLKPYGDDDGVSRQEEMEPWEDEDGTADIDIEWP